MSVTQPAYDPEGSELSAELSRKHPSRANGLATFARSPAPSETHPPGDITVLAEKHKGRVEVRVELPEDGR